jgi:hypothetical protein
VLRDVYRHDGADIHIGRRMPGAFRAAGLAAVGVQVRADLFPVGHPQRTLLPDLARNLRRKPLDRGLFDEWQLDELDRAVREHLDDPARSPCRIEAVRPR